MKSSTTGWPVSTMFITPVERVSVQGRGDYKYVNSLGHVIPMRRNFAKTAQKRYNFPQNIDGRTLKTGLRS